MDNDDHFNINKVITTTAIVILFVAVIVLLVYCFNVLLLILAGVLIAVYFRGFGLWISTKTRISEILSVFIVIVGTIILAGLLFWLLGPRVQVQMTQLSEKLPNSVSSAKDMLSQYEWGREILRYVNENQSQLSNQKIITTTLNFLKISFGIVSDLYVILLLGVFFTATPYVYKKGILSLVPPKGRDRANEVLNKIGFTLRSWLIGRIFSMFVVFILSAIGLLILGVPVPLALAVIAGLLNFIPNFGPIIAMIPAFLIGLSKDFNTAIIIIIIYIGIQILESDFITPLVQKKLINLSPALIIIAQVIMGIFTGLLGILLAMPIVAILMVLIRSLYIEDGLGKIPKQNQN